MINRVRVKIPNLVPYQLAFLYDKAETTVVDACTKSGKTASHIYWEFEIAHGKNPYYYTNDVKPGSNFWWIGPTYEQSSIAFKRMKQAIGKTPGYSFKNSKPQYIKTPYDTFIHFRSGDRPDNLFGEDVYAAVMDEYTRQPYESYGAIRSTLTSTGGPLKLIGNYVGTNHWGRRVIKSKYAKHFVVTADDAVREGVMTQQAVDRAREDLDHDTFMALYMCTGESDKNLIYIKHKINDLFSNTFIQPTGTMFITADAAFGGNDKFVLYVWDGDVVIARITKDACRHDEAIRWIRSVAAEYGVPMSHVAYDVGGPGDYMGSYMDDGRAVNFGSRAIKDKYEGQIKFENLRAQLYYHNALKTNRSQYHLKADTAMLFLPEELGVIKKIINARGAYQIIQKKIIRSILGRSPDDADAFVMKGIFDLDPAYDEKIILPYDSFLIH